MTLSQPEGALNERFKLVIEAEQRDDVKHPDFSSLEQDFEILSRSKQSSASFKSGKTIYKNTWTLRLKPLAIGEVSIRGVLIGSERARPITYLVLEPEQAPPPSPVRVEMFMESTRGYQFSAFVLTTQVAYAIELTEAELQEPTIENSLVFRIEQQTQGEEDFRGIPYQTIQQRYLVFPEELGESQIPSLSFTGKDSLGNSIEVTSEPLFFDIEEPPTKPWLPASELRIEEQWGESLEDLQVGDTLKRQLIIEAHNLPADWLPAIEMPSVEGISVYPKDVKTSQDTSSGVLVSRKVFNYDLLLTRAGPHRLPAVKVPWWDAIREQQEISELPIKELMVNQFTSLSSSAAIKPAPTITVTDTTKVSTPATDRGMNFSQPMSWHAWLWAFLALVCATGWSLSYARIKRLQNQQVIAQAQAQVEKPVEPVTSNGNDQLLVETKAFNQLARACSRNQPNAAYQYLITWAQALWTSVTIDDAEDVLFNARDPALGYLIKDLEHHIYEPDHDDPWQGDLLLRQLQKIRYKNQS